MRDFTKSVWKIWYRYLSILQKKFRYIEISRIKIGRIKISRKLSVDFFDPQREFWMSFSLTFALVWAWHGHMMHWFSFLVLLANVMVRACYNVSSAFCPSCASHSPTRHRVFLAPPTARPHNVWRWCLLGFWVLCCVCSRQHDMNTFMWTSECIVPTKTSVCKQGVWWTHHAMFKPPQNIGAWEKVPSFSIFYRKSLSFCDIYRKSFGICDIYRNATELLRSFFMIAIFFCVFAIFFSAWVPFAINIAK